MAYNENKEELKNYKPPTSPLGTEFRRFSSEEIESRDIRKEAEAIAKAAADSDVINKGRDPLIVGSVAYMLGV